MPALQYAMPAWHYAPALQYAMPALQYAMSALQYAMPALQYTIPAMPMPCLPCNMPCLPCNMPCLQYAMPALQYAIPALQICLPCKYACPANMPRSTGGMSGFARVSTGLGGFTLFCALEFRFRVRKGQMIRSRMPPEPLVTPKSRFWVQISLLGTEPTTFASVPSKMASCPLRVGG